MNLVSMVMSIILPILVACAAVPLALACKRHPMSRAVIIPDGVSGKAAAVAGPKTSDLNNRSTLTTAIVIGLVIVLVLSLMLVLMTHLEFLDFLLAPLAALIEMIGPNVVTVVFMLFVLATQVPAVTAALTWMTPLRSVLVAVLCLAVLLGWILVDSWITYNLMAALVFAVGAIMLQQRISFLRLSLILMIAAVLYDAWQVYGTGNMIEHARTMAPVIGAQERTINYPVMFLTPGEISLSPQRFGILGGGDVIIFSIMAIAAARFGRKVGSWAPVVWAFVGFTVGMVVCNLVGMYFDSPQPATIYIVPCCALPVLLYAKWKGSFDQLSIPFYDRQSWSEATQASPVKDA